MEQPYDYFEYKSTNENIKKSIKEIERHIKLLEKYGKKIKFEIS